MRPHLKMLVGDYLTYEKKSHQSGSSPHCRICQSGEPESLKHVILVCEALSKPRDRILMEIIQFYRSNNFMIDQYLQKPEELIQLILDPSSMNLPYRIHINDPILNEAFKLSRDLCYAVHSLRMKKIQNIKSQ